MDNEVLNGKDYVISIDDVTPITSARGAAYKVTMCEVSSSFSGSTDEQSVSNKCNGGFSNSNPGIKSWEFSGEAQAIDESAAPSAVSMNKMAELWKSGKKIWAKQSSLDPSLNTEVFTEGVVWVSSYERTAGTEDPFTFSYTLTGVGEPNFTAV